MPDYAPVYELIAQMQKRLAAYPQLALMFAQCFPNTLETTTELLDDGTTFVLTGDIPAMWLRDSSAQVTPYLPLAREDASLRRVFHGLIQRQARYIQIAPYANAFNRDPNGHGHKNDLPARSPWVWEAKFELDSLCYPVKLCYDYWQATQDASIFTHDVHRMFECIVSTMEIEQHHDTRSSYTFTRPDPLLTTDTLIFSGTGTRTNFTGMVWSGFRPSDDACTFGFLLPANMFAVVILRYLVTMAQNMYDDTNLAARAQRLCTEIDFGIQTYGLVNHPRYGRIYAYETDGFGNYTLMDDANIPSLLSLPYLGYCSPDDPCYLRTRHFILSEDNPYYYAGKHARGIGSPHTPLGHIWPLALIMQGLTTTDRQEQETLLHMLLQTTAGTNLMHESFHPDYPERYTRPWFAWANSLFSDFCLRWSALSPA